MTPAEIRAVGKLGGHAVAGLVSRIEQAHLATGQRVFTTLGPVSGMVRPTHDSVTRAVYLAVRAAGRAAGAMGGQAASLLGTARQPLSGEPGGALALAALNAVTGDRLAPDLAPLAIRMAVRADGHDLHPLTAGSVAAKFPNATPNMAVFVHGLAETENSWLRRAGASAPYGPRLAAEFGYTPVYIRYNTGRHVSANGHDLAELLESLMAAWPQRVGEILLIGHSMGGLVIRSACHYGRRDGAAWANRVRHIFYLGSPHLGAPLARAAGYAGWVLGQAPETRPFASMVASSDGIKDLRYGYVLDDDWADCDQDRCVRNHRREAPLLVGANHYVVSATVTAGPGDPLGAALGDLLVQPASAHGRRGAVRHIPFPVDLGRQLGGMHHFDLLNHRDVWAVMHGLLREHHDNTASPEWRLAALLGVLPPRVLADSAGADVTRLVKPADIEPPRHAPGGAGPRIRRCACSTARPSWPHRAAPGGRRCVLLDMVLPLPSDWLIYLAMGAHLGGNIMGTTVREELQDEFLSTLRKSQDIALDALKTLVETIQFATPAMPAVRVSLADRLPTAHDVVAGGYEFAERLLANQRQFADEVITVASPLLSNRTEKVAAE